MGLTPRVSTRTDVGCLRQRNEDAVVSAPERGILVVADGMGGHPSGDVASRVASEEALRVLLDWDPSEEDGSDESEEHGPLGRRMAEAVVRADLRVRKAVEEDPAKEGMGTTLTALFADVEHGRWGMGHVGDSRGYLLREGRLEQVTRDDSWVQEQVDAGMMTPDEARHHPWSSVLSQALGVEDLARPSVHQGRLRAGDVFLLCSDGLSGLVEDHELEEVLTGPDAGELDRAAEALVELARERGGPDNITVGLLRADETDSVTPPNE
ncbi:MAG: protein phosphatase 2C domain-containing protein [Gemmatimonadota bacterium]|jgi:protein phosphatase